MYPRTPPGPPCRSSSRAAQTRASYRIAWALIAASLFLGCVESKPKYEILGAQAPPGDAAAAEDSTRHSANDDPEHGPARSADSRAVQRDEPTVLDRLPPARGRTITVGPDEENEAGRSYHSSQLLDALRALAPGDRLVLEPGVYDGPVLIDTSMRDGRRPEPIQVVAKPDAVLTIRDKHSEAPAVLSLQRSYWELHGLELRSPQTGAGGIELRDVKTVLIADCHIHDLGGAGVRSLDKVREIRIQASHIHQIGLGRRPTDAFGISLGDARTRVVLADSQIHHTSAGPFWIAGTTVANRGDAAGWDILEIRSSDIK